jgi:transposase InsO family protein
MEIEWEVQILKGTKSDPILEKPVLLDPSLIQYLKAHSPDPGLRWVNFDAYSSPTMRKPLSVIGAEQSMSGIGNCYENATMEAFFSTLKTECFPENQLFCRQAQARRKIFEHIELY